MLIKDLLPRNILSKIEITKAFNDIAKGEKIERIGDYINEFIDSYYKTEYKGDVLGSENRDCVLGNGKTKPLKDRCIYIIITLYINIWMILLLFMV